MKENIFNQINDDNTAYWLGFIAADGAIVNYRKKYIFYRNIKSVLFLCACRITASIAAFQAAGAGAAPARRSKKKKSSCPRGINEKKEIIYEYFYVCSQK